YALTQLPVASYQSRSIVVPAKAGTQLSSASRADLQVVRDRFEQSYPIDRTQERVDRPLRVGHHPQHVAPGVDDAGDVPHRAVRIRLRRDLARRVTVPEQNTALSFEGREIGFRRDIASLTMSDRDAKHLAGLVPG